MRANNNPVEHHFAVFIDALVGAPDRIWPKNKIAQFFWFNNSCTFDCTIVYAITRINMDISFSGSWGWANIC